MGVTVSLIEPDETLDEVARRVIARHDGTNSVPYAPIIISLRRVVTFNGFIFAGLDLDSCRIGNSIYLATNVPEAYTHVYAQEKLIDVDPLARSVSEHSPVVQWHEVKDEIDLTHPKARRLLNVLDYYAIAPRTTFTFWNCGKMYGLATFTRDTRFSAQELELLTLFSKAVHSYLARPIVEEINQYLCLTKGEILCLRAAADGLTSEEIATNVSYSPETVTSYLKTAAKKLNASNRTQAIAHAIRRGIID